MTDPTYTAPICPRCRGTGIARVAPYLVGLRDDEAEHHMQQLRQVWDDRMVSYLGAV